jgi:indolepyruvate ferredoxin oxidoreductase
MTKTMQALAGDTLTTKFEAQTGRVYMSGIQALVRLLMVQSQRDRLAGVHTAGFVSGYRGSPLGGLDNMLWRMESALAENSVTFTPGLNEELAATSVWGSQQAVLGGRGAVDGVFGLWYAKGPGVDRSLDALKHANLAGTSRLGGVLAIAGDDHTSQSSTLPSQSDPTLIAAGIPILNPASVQEYLDYGLIGYGMSRYAGVWIGFKAQAETVESSASIAIDPLRITLVEPTDFVAPSDGLHIRWPDAPLAQEARLFGPKLAAAQAYARANGLDRLITNPRRARLGIVTSGKNYLDVRQALVELGIDLARAEALGIRIYKIGMSWPLEPQNALRFAEGLEDLLVVEEKQGVIEGQLTRLLFNLAADRRPMLVGKTDEQGATLLTALGELTPTAVARALFLRLKRLGHDDPEMEERVDRLQAVERDAAEAATQLTRTPFYCSGCPHNSSTRLPDGSRALAGIGCHGMAIYMPERRTTNFSQMGGEGAAWIGQAPFSRDAHIFQNLGDGTYAHSGVLGLRAAIAAKVNVTFKILFNGTVAMTGGQPAEGGFTVAQISRQVAAEGVGRIEIVTEDVDRYVGVTDLAPGTKVHDRAELDTIQRALREEPGVTVLIYDQGCAAEKRRMRKRGQAVDPDRRIFINSDVCEGCGDCSTASNCVSVVPLETELGRKRAIDQSSCNKDYSCIEGFCPSFVTVEGGSLRKRASASLQPPQPDELPEPVPPALDHPYGILIAGVGGTGVVTIGALLGMAAHLEGKGCTVSDFTGLSQKGGAVTSHVRISTSADELHAVRIGSGGADLLLGYDAVVSASPQVLARLDSGGSHAVIDPYVAPPAGFVTDPDLDFGIRRVRKSFERTVAADRLAFVEAHSVAMKLVGDAIAGNCFLLGFAFQKGLIPLSFAAIQRAIEINGAAVKMNGEAFAWGRLAAHDPSRLAALTQGPAEAPAVAPTLDDLIARRSEALVRYQDQAYAARYQASVALARHAGQKSGDTDELFARTVAEGLFKLMAYKDEYEVARLYTDGGFEQRLREQFEGDFTLRFSLAPPIFARRDPVTGRSRKRSYGGWMLPAMKLLARARGLRGTRFDPFGYLADRKLERSLIREYEDLILKIATDLTAQNLDIAVELAALPQRMRGFGHIKDANIQKARADQAALLRRFDAPAPTRLKSA